MIKHTWLFFIALLFIPITQANEMVFKKTNLTIHGINLQVEVAQNFAERSQGLMYRKTLPNNTGMLFLLDGKKIHCFWMKNTYLPLSLAYLDDTGKVLQIESLQPEDTKLVCSKEAVQYALEVPQGWFAQNNINEGTIIKGINHAIP